MAEKTRHEILAELWNCTPAEAKTQDERHLAGVAADTEAADNAATGEAQPANTKKLPRGAVVADVPAVPTHES